MDLVEFILLYKYRMGLEYQKGGLWVNYKSESNENRKYFLSHNLLNHNDVF